MFFAILYHYRKGFATNEKRVTTKSDDSCIQELSQSFVHYDENIFYRLSPKSLRNFAASSSCQ